jgi:hypothetical protein
VSFFFLRGKGKGQVDLVGFSAAGRGLDLKADTPLSFSFKILLLHEVIFIISYQNTEFMLDASLLVIVEPI